ncbi:hypothetical protein R9X47_26905 [Wukongibacter baidiensis]|uniref:hypothetical protein n=1 Tax=Wukongibacter baidiensis TaxID=1723361 RepID=UPI003D7F935F
MYKIDIDSEKMELKVTISGTFKNEDLSELFDSLEKHIEKIDLRKYTLIFDAKDHEPASSNSMPLQVKALKLLTLNRDLLNIFTACEV